MVVRRVALRLVVVTVHDAAVLVMDVIVIVIRMTVIVHVPHAVGVFVLVQMAVRPRLVVVVHDPRISARRRAAPLAIASSAHISVCTRPLVARIDPAPGA